MGDFIISFKLTESLITRVSSTSTSGRSFSLTEGPQYGASWKTRGEKATLKGPNDEKRRGEKKNLFFERVHQIFVSKIKITLGARLKIIQLSHSKHVIVRNEHARGSMKE